MTYFLLYGWPVLHTGSVLHTYQKSKNKVFKGVECLYCQAYIVQRGRISLLNIEFCTKVTLRIDLTFMIGTENYESRYTLYEFL